MTEEEWFNFVSGGDPDIVPITALCRRIGASTSLVWMRHDYALKSAIKHRLRAAHFPMLPIIIECGRVVCDKPGHKASHATGHDGGGRAPSDKLATLGRNPCGDFRGPAKCVRFVINS